MNSPTVKVEEIGHLFKGINEFNTKMLFWVCQCVLTARTTCLAKCAEDSAAIDSGPSTVMQR